MRKIALVILFVLGGAAVALAFVGLPAQSLVGYVAREFESQTGYGLRIDGPVKLTLWRGIEFTGDTVRVTEPKSEKRDPLLTAAQIRLALPIGSVLSQHVRISEVALTSPVVRLSFTDSASAPAGEHTASSPSRSTADRKVIAPFTIERITVRDGTVIYRQDKRDLQTRFDKIELEANLPADGTARMVADARWDGEPLRVTTESASGAKLFEGRPVAFQTKVEAPGLLRSAVTTTGNFAVTGGAIVLADLKGVLDDTQITGAASLDWSKPKLYISADLNLERLRLFEPPPGAAPPKQAAARNTRPGKLWSDKQLDLAGLNMLDVSIKAQVRDLKVHTVRFGSAELTTSIRDGVMSIAVPKSDLYGGAAKGRVVLDASRSLPTQSVRIELTNLQALPFLTDAVGFTKVEGRMHAKADFIAAGGSVQSMVEGLAGNGELLFENGAIRELSMPGIAQSLTRGSLAGWQQSQPDKTEFASIASTFEARSGKLRTDDLRMTSSVFRMSGAGTADLPTESIDFRVEPSITMGGSRGGRRGDNSISVPVTIRGPWANPQINAELGKLLDNPDALISNLRLFGDEFMSSKNRPRGSQQPDDKNKADGDQGGMGGDGLRGIMKQFMR